jgi:large subunit ribosomal protein L5
MSSQAIQPIQLTPTQWFDSAKSQIITANPEQNKFALPDVDKISINVGVGKYDNKQKQEIAEYLEKITSQKPRKALSRDSIASFKSRKGDVVGLVVTLRGQKAKDFLLQLVYIALPRTRDFKGIKSEVFNNNFSSYSLGIESVSIFPSIGYDTTVNFGMQINVCFKHPTPQNRDLLNALNLPFKK